MAKRGPHGVSTEYAAIVFNIIYIMRTNICNGSIVMSACGSIQMSALW